MRIVGSASEAEIVAAFLRGELDSPRYVERLGAFLALELLLGTAEEMGRWTEF